MRWLSVLLLLTSSTLAGVSDGPEDLRAWFNSLQSKRGVCCYDFDGQRLSETDGCNFYAQDLISLGVPVCYGGGQ